MSWNEYLRSFRRSWVHHTGMQLATLSVLAATFTVVAFVLSLSLNLKRVLSHWGESAQMSVYLEDTIQAADREALKAALEKDQRIRSVEFVGKEQATSAFRQKMSSYAPDLLEDTEFSNPFPASFQVSLVPGVSGDVLAATFEAIAQQLSAFKGVEDVSYGQSWVRNYSAFVGALSTGGWVIVAILIAGSFFVIGNSVRASIAARRDEIEILELVGATSRMIRAPFVFEGAALGWLAAAISLAINFGLYLWEAKLLQSSMAFARLGSNLAYFGVLACLGLLFAGAMVGALGAYFTIRKINDGWAASQKDA
nr:ABC transporter permease [Pseudobdellovibrionaceae bacterium]